MGEPPWCFCNQRLLSSAFLHQALLLRPIHSNLSGPTRQLLAAEWCQIGGGAYLRTGYSLLLVTVAVSTLTLGVFQPLALGNPQTQKSDGAQIKVTLIPQTKTIKVGGTLEVRVEIWNVGSHPLFIEKAIYEQCGPISPLSLRLELGPPMKPQEGYGCASDCIYGAKDSFARRLVIRWMSLPVGNFYGTVVTMSPDSFAQLKTPGRWRLRGVYKSMGDLSSERCFDTAPFPDNKEQVQALPYDAWQGEVDTNTVWIEVVRGGNSSAVKK